MALFIAIFFVLWLAVTACLIGCFSYLKDRIDRLDGMMTDATRVPESDNEEKKKWDIADDISKIVKYSPSPKERLKQKREDK